LIKPSFDIINNIFDSIPTKDKHNCGNNIPPTLLYNEGWMLRLVLYWFKKNSKADSLLIPFYNGSHWFSEGRLETIFVRKKKLTIGEGYTVADGVYGNISIGTQDAQNKGKNIIAKGISDIRLKEDCRQFVAIEAKMFSGFSKGVKNASSFNQVARYIACMAYVVSKSEANLNVINDLAFYAFLPDCQIAKTGIKKLMCKEHILKTVKDRITGYNKDKPHQEIDEWFTIHFEPFLKKLKLKILSWEEILDYIHGFDEESYSSFNEFYKLCLYYNRNNPNDTVDRDIL